VYIVHTDSNINFDNHTEFFLYDTKLIYENLVIVVYARIRDKNGVGIV
jgi:hypothetical protein